MHNYRYPSGGRPRADVDALAPAIEPLPFMPRGLRPPCADEADAFNLAAEDTRARVGSRRYRRRIVAAEETAKNACDHCPVLEGCREYALTTFQTWGVWGGTNTLEREAWWRRHRLVGNDRRTALVPTDKFKDVPTIPLFSVEQLAPARDERPKRPRSVAMGNCPMCSKNPVGLVRQGDHLVWRSHFYTTWGGAARQCQASNVAICVAPEPEGKEHNYTPVRCAHDKGSKA